MTVSSRSPGPSSGSPVGVGVVVPYDFALDAELWRWLPAAGTLHLTRTPCLSVPVTIEQAMLVADAGVVGQAARDVATPEPRVVAYACTSGSFVRGLAGERELVTAMLASGIPEAVTTSGALLEALAELDVRRVAVATPYDDVIGARLAAFLAEADLEVVSAAHLGRDSRIWTVPPQVTHDLVRSAVRGPCDAVFISCTNLPTYDLIPELEDELGLPVITANQVTMWAALKRAGLDATGPGQRLLADPAPGASA